jgi:hypothetical protein
VVRNNKDDSDCEEGTDTCFNIVQNADVGVECLLGDICEVFDLVGRAIIGGIAELFTWGDFEFKKFLAGAYGIGDFQFEEDFLEDLALSDPDPMELAQVQPDPTKIEESENTTFSLGAIDVEIEDGGLTVAFPADFFSQEDASDRDQTPGASLSPADTPTVAEVIAVGSEVTLMVADDVFGQTYASMKEARQLDAFCTDLDGKTVGDLLPAESDGGCDSLGTSGTLAGAGIQGICHAIRDTDCESLIDETVDASTINLTAIKQGTCHGFEDTECSTLPTGFYGIQLPADCDKIGQSAEDSEDPDFEAGRSVVISRGRCAGLQGAVCDSLTALSGDPDDTAIKQGACHGEQGTSCTTLTGRFAIGTCTAVQEPCSVLNFNLLARAQCVISKAQISITEGILTAAEKGACGATPTKNISSTDGLLLCAAEQLEPDLLIREDDPGDTEVATDLLLNQLDVSFALDRGADGYTGSPQDLLGCFSQEGNEAPDCLLIGVCLNLTLQTAMGINSAECTADEVGFTFRVIDVIPSELAIGLVCSAPTETEDQLVVGEGFNSVVIDTIREKAQAFTPVFCIEGLDLGGILDFSSDDAKLFGLKTTGATGSEFADYLGITVDLASPTP